MFLWQYTDIKSRVKGKKGTTWVGALLIMEHAAERGPWLAHRLREWTHAYIINCKNLPHNIYGCWNVSLLKDEDLTQEIHLHLQGICKFMKAMDIVNYLDTPEIKMHCIVPP